MDSIDKGRKGDNDEHLYRDITIGEVVDTNDPQQMARVRVLCLGMGDDDQALLENIPWATAATPLGGITETTARGRDGNRSSGPVSYGMWNVPKVGSHVLVACIDGDTRFRVYLGCIHPQFMTHTMPHGRYIANGTNRVDGPLSSSEQPILPLSTHQRRSFSPNEKDPIVPNSPGPGSDHTIAPEFVSRGADYAVASIRDELVGLAATGEVSVGDDNAEDIVTEIDGNKLNHLNGYKESRVVKGIGFKSTDGKNYDPQMYAWTTPGFHTIAMDDSANNCRIRLRTTHGSQIILDDTNERIYISTADGNTWIEMDEKGNIDMYASRNLSFHAKKDINFTTKESFRVKADKGIHLESDEEVRIHSKTDLHMRSESSIRQHSGSSTHIQSDVDLHMKSAGDIFQEGNTLHITAPTNITGNVSIQNQLDVQSDVFSTRFHAPVPGTNTGPSTTPASPASNADEKQAYWTNRIPNHEPYARGMTDPTKTDNDSGNTHADAAEYPYDSPDVGKTERGESLDRNINWHR